MTPTATAETLVGCALRIASTGEVFLVEACRAADTPGKVVLRLSAMTGVSIERVADLNQISCAATERVTVKDFFVPRGGCPLCSHPAIESKWLFSVRQIFWNNEVRECLHCGMAYKDPVANPRLLAHVYTKAYTHFASTGLDKDAVSMYRSRAARLGNVRRRHLDYGCGAGGFVEAALQAGWDSFGADPFLPSTSASPSLKGRLWKIDASDPAIASIAGKFDCISMWAVVEHLTSFKDTFEGLVRLLKPGGTIVFNSPNAHSLIAKYSGSSWRMATLIEHLEFCTPSAIRWLAANWGLKVKKLRICGSPFPLGRAMGASDQGLGSPPFPVLGLDEHLSNSPPTPKNEMPKRVGPLNSVGKFLLSTGGQTIGTKLLREFIHLGRIGDHIEITLKLG